MIESLCLISTKFSCCILTIDGCFSHAMKNCALSKAPLRYNFFLSNFYLLEILMREIFFFFAMMVKLTNSLVEPRTHKFWHSF
jgi:hypothetical protein